MMEPKKLCPQTSRQSPLVYFGARPLSGGRKETPMRKIRAIAMGTLTLFGNRNGFADVYVLADGTSLVAETAIATALFGRSGVGGVLELILARRNTALPYGWIEPTDFICPNGRVVNGYDLTFLVDLCRWWAAADDCSCVRPRFRPVVRNARRILASLDAAGVSKFVDDTRCPFLPPANSTERTSQLTANS